MTCVVQHQHFSSCSWQSFQSVFRKMWKTLSHLGSVSFAYLRDMHTMHTSELFRNLFRHGDSTIYIYIYVNVIMCAGCAPRHDEYILCHRRGAHIITFTYTSRDIRFTSIDRADENDNHDDDGINLRFVNWITTYLIWKPRKSGSGINWMAKYLMKIDIWRGRDRAFCGMFSKLLSVFYCDLIHSQLSRAGIFICLCRYWWKWREKSSQRRMEIICISVEQKSRGLSANFSNLRIESDGYLRRRRHSIRESFDRKLIYWVAWSCRLTQQYAFSSNWKCSQQQQEMLKIDKKLKVGANN